MMRNKKEKTQFATFVLKNTTMEIINKLRFDSSFDNERRTFFCHNLLF